MPEKLIRNHGGAIVVLTLLSLLPGCAREIRVHGYDKASLDALAPYNPVYTLDNNGRVIDLKLENKQLDDAAFDELAKLTALRALSLYGSSVTDHRLEKLISIGQLKQLGLGRTEITDDGLAHLAELPNLRHLWVSRGESVSDAAVAQLRAHNANLVVHRQ